MIEHLAGKSYPKEFISIFKDIEEKSKSKGIEIKISPDSHVSYDDFVTCNGYFEAQPNPTLAVATGKPLHQWLPVLLHESSHMDQYIENCKEWQDCTLPDGSDAVVKFFEWVEDNSAYDKKDVVEWAQIAINVELDCEKRTVDKIVRYGLEETLNVQDYIQQANSYIYFYTRVLEIGKFYSPGKEPYNNPDVWKTAPTHFMEDYTDIPDDLYNAFKQHC